MVHLYLRPPEDESPYERDSRLQREEDARRVSDQIDQQIRQEKAELKQQKNIRKVLLLGQVRPWQICLNFMASQRHFLPLILLFGTT